MVNYTLCPCCGSSEIVTAFKTSFFKTPALKCLECFFHFNKMTEQSFELLEKYYKNDYWISDFKKPTSKIRIFLNKFSWLKFEHLRAHSQFSYLENFKGDVLDVGAGLGATSILFANRGYKVTAIEPDLKNIKKLKTFSNITVYQSNLENLQLEKKFDIVILSHVLEHVLDVMKFLTSLRKLLSNRGILFIEVPDCSNSHNLNHSIMQSPHLSHFTKKSLDILVRKAGFSLVRFDTMYFDNNLTLFQQGLRFLRFFFFSKDAYKRGSETKDNVFRLILKF